MANSAENDGGQRWRRWALAGWATVAALIAAPLAGMFVMAATADDENLKLTRNDVARTASGGRVWRGGLTNRTDRPHRDVAVVILFLDREGEPVGQASARAGRLDPGETLDLQATLPAGAARMQVYSLRWRAGDDEAALGPYRQWRFGQLGSEGV